MIKEEEMKNGQVINYEKALEEKRQQQKTFLRENGYPSSVSELVIAFYEERSEKK